MRIAKSFCASTVVHGSLLVAALAYWGLPLVQAKGRAARDFQVEIAKAIHPEPLPEPPPEEQPDLLEPLTSEPETLEFLAPPEPIADPTLARVEFADLPAGIDRPFRRPRVKSEPVTQSQPLVEQEVTAPPKPLDAPPPTQAPVGTPDPVEARPTPLHNPAPYPKRAYEREIEGAVVLELTVDVTGEVIAAVVTASSGSSLLDKAALAAVDEWRFEPGTRDGAPVEMKLPWRLLFSLKPLPGAGGASGCTPPPTGRLTPCAPQRRRWIRSVLE
ncbi:MAG: TonB family protein [Planctomycetota bacterium]|nr:TonB family protein [Planctomycetota bacterium]